MSILKKLTTTTIIFLLLGTQVCFAGTARFGFEKVSGKSRYILNPGETVQDKAIIKMVDDLDGAFNIILSSQNGKLISTNEENKDLSLSNWLSVKEFDEENTIKLKKDETGKRIKEITYRISVPKYVAPGDYSALLSAALIPMSSKLEGNQTIGLSLSPAIGISLQLIVKGSRVGKLTLQNFSFGNLYLDKETDTQTLVLNYKLKNEGNTLLIPITKIQIKNIFGKLIHEEEKSLSPSFPGGEDESKIEIKQLPKTIGLLNISSSISYKPLLNEENKEAKSYNAGTGSLKIIAIPWKLTIALSGLILIITAFFCFKAFHKTKTISSSKLYSVYANDTVSSIAGKFGILSKDIIFANNLKRPYPLTPGSKILIPDQI